MKLSAAEKRFLTALVQLHKERLPFAWITVARLMAAPSVVVAWDCAQALTARGMVVKGHALARVPSPVITSKGRGAMLDTERAGSTGRRFSNR